MVVHRAADVEQHQHLHGVVPLGHQLQIEPAGVARGGAIVPSRSSSSAAPSRAKRRSRRSASLMLRVPSSTGSSKSRIFALLPHLDRRGDRAAGRRRCECPRGCSRRRRTARCRRCRSTCCRPRAVPSARASRSRRRLHQLVQPPIASIWRFSSSGDSRARELPPATRRGTLRPVLEQLLGTRRNTRRRPGRSDRNGARP